MSETDTAHRHTGFHARCPIKAQARHQTPIEGRNPLPKVRSGTVPVPCVSEITHRLRRTFTVHTSTFAHQGTGAHVEIERFPVSFYCTRTVVGRVRLGRPLLSRPRGAVGSGRPGLRILSRPRFRPSRGRAGVSLGLDGCEVCLCDPCARMRPCVPCVSVPCECVNFKTGRHRTAALSKRARPRGGAPT